MIMKEYLCPKTVEEAISLYTPKECIYFAGGTDLMVKAKERQFYKEKIFIDISQIDDLSKIYEDEENIYIGANATIQEFLKSELSQKNVLVKEAASHVANKQVRNRATLAGNLANACPASDLIGAFLVSEASICIQGKDKEYVLPIKELFQECKACLRHSGMHARTCFFADPSEKKLTIQPGELIKEIILPKMPSTAKWYFEKLTQNKNSDMAILNLAAMLILDEKDQIETLKISVGSIFPKPICFDEKMLDVKGLHFDEAAIKKCSQMIYDQAIQNQKILADGEYKLQILRDFIADTLSS